MSKTVKQLAEELGISKQALQKRIAREPLHTSIQPYISTENNTKYIATEGETLIKAAYNKQDIDKKSIDNNQVHTDKTIDKTIDKTMSIDKYIALLENQIEDLRAQLDQARADKEKQTEDFKTQLAKVEADKLDYKERLDRAEEQKNKIDNERQTILAQLLDLKQRNKVIEVHETAPAPAEQTPAQTAQEQTQSKPRSEQRQQPTARKTPKKGIFTTLFNRKGR